MNNFVGVNSSNPSGGFLVLGMPCKGLDGERKYQNEMLFYVCLSKIKKDKTC